MKFDEMPDKVDLLGEGDEIITTIELDVFEKQLIFYKMKREKQSFETIMNRILKSGMLRYAFKKGHRIPPVRSPLLISDDGGTISDQGHS